MMMMMMIRRRVRVYHRAWLFVEATNPPKAGGRGGRGSGRGDAPPAAAHAQTESLEKQINTYVNYNKDMTNDRSKQLLTAMDKFKDQHKDDQPMTSYHVDTTPVITTIPTPDEPLETFKDMYDTGDITNPYHQSPQHVYHNDIEWAEAKAYSVSVHSVNQPLFNRTDSDDDSLPYEIVTDLEYDVLTYLTQENQTHLISGH